MSETNGEIAVATRAPEATSNYPISSVENALKLLMLFSREKSVRIVDASRELNVARSTAHRLVQMLQQFELVTQDQNSKSYMAGPALIRMSLDVTRQLDLRVVSRPIMTNMVAELEETMNVAELRGTSILFTGSVETTRSLRIGERTGRTLPAHSSASGKAILSALDSAELHALYPNEALEKLTSQTIATRSELEKELETVRANGYATNFGESETEVHSVAVPIRDSNGAVRGALALTAPPLRMKAKDVRRFADALKLGAQEIGQLMPI